MARRRKLGVCNDDCEDCKWLYRSSAVRICDYYLQTGKHRYADKDGKCAVKDTNEPGKITYLARKARGTLSRKTRGPLPGGTKWDTTLGKEMWLHGDGIEQIAETLGVHPGTFRNYASKYWKELKPEREAAIKARGGRMSPERVRKVSGKGLNGPEWDAKLAKQMWLEGATFTAIAEAVGAKPNTVKNYAYRRWDGMREQRNAAVAEREARKRGTP